MPGSMWLRSTFILRGHHPKTRKGQALKPSTSSESLLDEYGYQTLKPSTSSESLLDEYGYQT